MGYPASGKSTIAREYEKKGYVILNRDKLRGKVTDLLPLMEQHLRDGKKVLLDNTYPTAESRKPFIDLATKLGKKIKCLWLTSTIEQAQFNACLRMVRKYGKLLSPAEISKATDDPNMFPPAWPFKYRKIFETPRTGEGFEAIEKTHFTLNLGPEYENGAYIFDYDGTLRESKGPQKWPLKPSEVVLLPNRKLKGKRNTILLLGAITGDYFLEDTDSRDRCDFDLTLVEAPIMISHGNMRVEPEKELS